MHEPAPAAAPEPAPLILPQPAAPSSSQGKAAAWCLLALLVLGLGLEARVWVRATNPGDYANAAALVRSGFAPAADSAGVRSVQLPP